MTEPPLPAPDTEVPQPRALPRSPARGLTTVPAGPTGAAADADPDSLFTRAGGEPFFDRLVDAFYDRVAQDAVLRPLYPEEDLGPARTRLRMFLVQYWGGPSTYSQERGHPRLRMRHAPFPVGTAQIAAWLRCMRGALDEVRPPPDIEAELWAYVLKAAPFMRNVED